MPDDAPVRVKPTALFVDFDNIYIPMSKVDTEAAEAFATRPQDWLASLAEGTDEHGPYRRRFVVLACYLNPSTFSRFRAFFTNAGFAVIDCPSLTRQGKSSADINMALGAVDALNSSTEYAEFVFLASDADYTPVVARVRAANRRVTVVTSGPSATAYRAIADTVLASESLMEMVLSGARSEDRAGHGSEAPVHEPAEGEGSAARGPAATAVAAALVDTPGWMRPARMAEIALEAEPHLSGDWEGFGSFTRWLQAKLPEFEKVPEPAPGWVIDPDRVDRNELPAASRPSLNRLQEQTATIADVPRLSQEHYNALHRALAEDAQRHEFRRFDMSKRVRNALQLDDVPVSRAVVNYVITGLQYDNFRFGSETTAQDVASAWASTVVDRCRARRMEFSEAEESEVRDWVGGGLARPSGGADTNAGST